MSDVFEIVGNFKVGGKNYKPNKPGEPIKTIAGLDDETRDTLLAKGRIKAYETPPAALPPEQVNAGQSNQTPPANPPAEPPAPVAPAPEQPPVAPQPTAEPGTPPANPTADQIQNDPDLQ